MATHGLTKSAGIKYPVFFDDAALTRLVKIATDSGWQVDSVDFDMTDGGHVTDCALADLQAVDESVWDRLKTLTFRFCLGENPKSYDHHATVSFERIPRYVLFDPEVSYYINGSDPGSVLIFEKRLEDYFRTLKKGNRYLPDIRFWLITLFALIAVWANMWDEYRTTPTHNALAVLTVLGVMIIVLTVLLLSRRILFPKVVIAIGTGASQHYQKSVRKQRFGAVAYDILKVVLGAILGAALQAYFSRKH